MSPPSLDLRLAELEAARYRFDRGDGGRIEKFLRFLDRVRFPDPSSVIRFHEALMFVRAFPQNAAVLRLTERILNGFHKKVEAQRESGADMDAFDSFEYGGIVGTEMEDTLSFDVARWLIERMPGQVEIAWDNFEPGRELGTTGPRFMPLLEDDAFVEADTPFRRWLEAASGVAGKKASGKGKADRLFSSLGWLIGRFEQLPLPEPQKAELYESLRIPLRWKLGNSPITRTRNWHPVRKIFYHDGPLISRSQVSLVDELAKRPPSFTRLSLQEGERIADMIREVMLVRYRELYGTTLADPRSVVRADFGRGVSIYLWNLPPDRRLPLRAYVAGLTLKNGVPINYIEAIGLCEWMEVGFNTFYTFRGGEAGWIYAQVLRCLCARMGTTVVSVYPYQLGHDNDEAIQSGAFWFYRKLGFRPGRAEIRKLVEYEEKKIAADPKYRTPARTLKRLAAGHVFYELLKNDFVESDFPGSEVPQVRAPRLGANRGTAEAGAWDTFSTRNIGLRVNERMAREFAGDADRMRAQTRRALERTLRVSTSTWSLIEKTAFENFALLFTPAELRAWAQKEKEDLLKIVRAKTKPDEMVYLRLTQRHSRLRGALLTLGS
jgi:hypothetical protein